jgi:hypothetical protein
MNADPSFGTGAVAGGARVLRNAEEGADTTVVAGGRADPLCAPLTLPAVVALALAAVHAVPVCAAVTWARLLVAGYTAVTSEAAAARLLAHAVAAAAIDAIGGLLLAAPSSVTFLADARAVVTDATLAARLRADGIVTQRTTPTLCAVASLVHAVAVQAPLVLA